MQPTILAFSGSLRKNSLNQKLLSIAAEGAINSGAKVKIANLTDRPLPLFNEDIEKEGRPKEADEWRKDFIEHNGLLIASPEYNGSITGALKNLIDWMTRSTDESTPLDCFQGKTATILSGSPGGLGGIRALPHLGEILSSIGVTVLPNRLAIPHVEEKLEKIHSHPELIEKLHSAGSVLTKSIQAHL